MSSRRSGWKLRRLFASKNKPNKEHEDFPSGFEQWYPEGTETPQPHDADIIFAHGLTGNRNTTFTHRLEDVPWPKTVLPLSIPSARLLTFGYDAHPGRAGHRTSHNKLRDHAQNFVHELSTRRRDSSTLTKPIIFVGHSMGGLLIKAALTFASDAGRSSSEYAIVSSTIGIIFMGTPHGGSWHADWSSIPVHVFRPFKDINMSLIQVLQSNDEYLKHLQESFRMLRDCLRNEGQKIDVWSIYEELPLSIPIVNTSTMIVTPESARLLEGHDISIHKDHVEMVRFRGQVEDPLGKQPSLFTIVGKLKEIMQSDHDPGDIELALRRNHTALDEAVQRSRQSLKDSLWFDTMFHQLTRIEEPDADTCQWIYDQPEYKEWIGSIHSDDVNKLAPMLLIKGTLGSGKSTLLRSIMKRRLGIPEISLDLYLSFFFSLMRRGLHQSIEGFYRSILFQIVKKFPEANDLVRALREDMNSTEWHVTEMWNLIQSVFKSEIFRGKIIVLVVDAIDQCIGISPDTLVLKLQSLRDLASSSGTRLLLCVSCREHPVIKFASWSTVMLAPGNEGDLKAIAKRRLRDFLPDDEGTTATLERRLIKKAQGNILWLNIVLGQLRQQYFAGVSLMYLAAILDDFLPELKDLYVQCLTKLNSKQKQISAVIIGWLLTTKRALNLEELTFGVGISLLNQEVISSLETIERAIGASLDDLEALERFVTHNTCALLVVKRHKNVQVVDFSHDSVRLFFLTKQGIESLGVQDFESFTSSNQDLITVAFQRYSKMHEVQKSYHYDSEGNVDFINYTTNSTQGELRSISKKLLPLARYFSEYGFDHVKESAWYRSGRLQTPFPSDSNVFADEMRAFLRGWVYSLCSVTDHFEKGGQYDDTFWKAHSGLSFVTLNAGVMGLNTVQLNQLVACINNRGIFLRNMAKDREEGSHIWAGQGDEYVQIFYLSSRPSKSVELSDLVGSKLREAAQLESDFVDTKLRDKARLEVSSYQQICNGYASGVAFVAIFHCEAAVPVTNFRVEHSTPIKQWREQKPEPPRYIPLLTDWRLEMDHTKMPSIVDFRQTSDSNLSMTPFHTRSDRGYISLLFCQGLKPVPFSCALEISCQDEHNTWSDPDEKNLLFEFSPGPSLTSQWANAGISTHIRLFLISDDPSQETQADEDVPSATVQSDETAQRGIENVSERPESSSSGASGPYENWKDLLEQFAQSQKTEVEGIFPDDDHVSFADRHEDEIFHLRRINSVRSLSCSLQGLDLEYDRHSVDDGASMRSVTQWMEKCDSFIFDRVAENGGRRVLIDGNKLFTRKVPEYQKVQQEHEYFISNETQAGINKDARERSV